MVVVVLGVIVRIWWRKKVALTSVSFQSKVQAGDFSPKLSSPGVAHRPYARFLRVCARNRGWWRGWGGTEDGPGESDRIQNELPSLQLSHKKIVPQSGGTMSPGDVFFPYPPPFLALYPRSDRPLHPFMAQGVPPFFFQPFFLPQCWMGGLHHVPWKRRRTKKPLSGRSDAHAKRTRE